MVTIRRLLVVLLIGAGVLGFLAVKRYYAQRSHDHTAGVAHALYRCPMHPDYTSDKPGDCPICGMRLVKVTEEQKPSPVEKKEAYVCSMCPGVRSDKPGSCPECGMALAKAEAGDAAAAARKEKLMSICIEHNCSMLKTGKPCAMLVIGKPGEKVYCPECGGMTIEPEKEPREKPSDILGYAAVVISQQRQQLIGIKTAPVEQKKLQKTIRASGKIAYDPELYQAEAEYIQSVQSHEKLKRNSGMRPEIVAQAQTLVNAGKMKLKLLGLSDELIDGLIRKGEADKTLLLSETGQTVWMYANIYESELSYVKVGQEVKVSAEGAGFNRTFNGKIQSIDSVIDPQTRSVRIRAVLDNNDGLLKPNMYVAAQIAVDLGEKLVVPADAVLDSGERQISFVDIGNGMFQPRLVRIGAKTGDLFEVLDGLKAGEKVVTSAAFFVDSESRLKAAVGDIGTHKHGEQSHD